MAVKDWSSTAASNTSVDAVNIAEGAPFANMNDMGRAIIANVRQEIADLGATVTAATLATISGASQIKYLAGNTTISGFDTAVTGLYRELKVLGTPVLDNGASLAVQGGADLTLAAGDLVKARSLGAGSWFAQVERASGLAIAAALPTGYFQGFTLSNNGSDATHDIDVAAGKARDDTDAYNLVTTATVVKQTDSSFAEYSNPATASGGMDSTTPLGVGAATVHVFMIGGAGKDTQPFFSTSINPTLPSGFTYKVYVNSLLWSGSAMRPFLQRGRDAIMLVTPIQQSATAVGTSAQTITLTVPTGLALEALVGLCAVALGTAANHAISALDVTDLDPNSSGSAGLFPIFVTPATGAAQNNSGWVKTNTSGQVRARASASNASNSQNIGSLGWRVMR